MIPVKWSVDNGTIAMLGLIVGVVLSGILVSVLASLVLSNEATVPTSRYLDNMSV